jgi:macrolide transport system ATP-binding/permease protein
MPALSLRFEHVSFTYDTASQPLICDLSVHFASGWTGIVGPNGAGKSTILKLSTGILEPWQGHITIPGLAIHCEQRTDSVPDHLEDLAAATSGTASRIREQLGVQNDWAQRWQSLSHGERKRAQIAVALWQNPVVLALDEPTNHLDAQARALLFDALSAFRGVGLLVSHDRTLLDTLCQQCLFVDPPDAVLRAGNYSQGLDQASVDDVTARREQTRARQNLERLEREAVRRKEAAMQADRKRSKRGLAPKDRDARAKIDLARVSGKDGVAGRKLRQLEGRLKKSRTQMESLKVKRTFALGIWMEGARSLRNTLFNLPPGSLQLSGELRLDFPELVMTPEDRIALTGPNGCGKSTLLRRIVGSLNLEPDRVTYIPQEIDLTASQEILARVRGLPREKLGQMMVIISRLGSRPQRLLETEEPSPGEIRKILLASGIANVPHLIVMDEPTNHLDLPSIECLEHALADCPCGLLLVSHDQRFLDALTQQHWRIAPDNGNEKRYILKT